MQISIIGTGYVGLVTGACLAEMGHKLIFLDTNTAALERIKIGQAPFFEPGLEELLRKHLSEITVTADYPTAIENSDVTFICVGTPSHEDGSIDLNSVISASRAVGQALKRKSRYYTVLVKSTVLPGTTEQIIAPCIEKMAGKSSDYDFGIGMNPEFLREGAAVDDFFHPDRIVFGVRDGRTKEVLEEIYRPVECQKITTAIKVAEMIKYTSNAFLATKISFANEIGNLCKKMGINSYEVFHGVGMDKRINPHFFRSGIGFGGSCFPKDVRALISFARSQGLDPNILETVLKTNEDQPKKFLELLQRRIDISKSTIGILGLAFKPDTDDIRESRAIPVIRALLDHGSKVIAYDPLAMANFQRLFPGIMYASSAEEVLKADAVLIITEWPEFERLNFKNTIVIDGRGVRSAREDALIYEGLCW